MGVHHGQILRILRDSGPQSRARLARQSELSATTLTHVTAQLIEAGFIVERSQDSKAGGIGRPATSVCLAPDASYTVGVHVGAGNLQVVLTNLEAEPKAFFSSVFDPASTSPEDLVARIDDVTAELCDEVGIERKQLIAVGVGVPGPVDVSRRRLLVSINLGWQDLAFADLFEKRLLMPAVIEHNVTAMALAESCYGIGKNAVALLYVYLRTGLGAGLIVDGKPFRPGGHGAVELGHIQVAQNGVVCSCGNTGCLETFLCEQVLMQVANLSGQPPERLLDRVRDDERAWQAVMQHLTTALASAVNLLAPDCIIFGGHLGEAPEAMFDHLHRDLSPRVMPHLRNDLAFERASFGAQAGAIGGAAVALDHFFYSGVLS